MKIVLLVSLILIGSAGAFVARSKASAAEAQLLAVFKSPRPSLKIPRAEGRVDSADAWTMGLSQCESIRLIKIAVTMSEPRGVRGKTVHVHVTNNTRHKWLLDAAGKRVAIVARPDTALQQFNGALSILLFDFGAIHEKMPNQ